MLIDARNSGECLKVNVMKLPVLMSAVAILAFAAVSVKADTLTLVSYGTGTTPSGGAVNNSALAFVGVPSTTYNISPGIVWASPVSANGVQSSWVSNNPNSGPTGFVVEPDGVYTYLSTITDIAGHTYSGNFTVMADDTVDVFLNGIKIVSDSLNSPNDLKCESNVPDCTTPDTVSFSFLGHGLDFLTFEVEQTGLASTGVDFAATASEVPEPASLLLVGSSLLSAGIFFRRGLFAR